MPADGVIAPMPRDASFLDATAVLYGGLLALHLLRRGGVHPEDRVMIHGAAGAVGSSAVQLAAWWGARVTGVCGPTNLELVSGLGAVEVIDYTTTDVAVLGPVFDLVLDAVGKTSTARTAAARAPGGRFVSVNDGTPRSTAAQLAELVSLQERGALVPVIDWVYRLQDVVEAHRYVQSGHKRGNVFMTLD